MSNDMTGKTTKVRKTPTLAFSLIVFVAIVAVIVVLINIGVNTTLTLFLAAVIAMLAAVYLNVPWKELEEKIISSLSDCLMACLIVIFVGMLVGIWMAGGTVPALMYYGIKLIAPSILVPLAFVLCALTSQFTGTSFGAIATMGLALVGVASTTTIPMPLIVGAIGSGAYFGDKMSPMSDTTNLAAGITKVPLYEHIYSMRYTTWPAAIVCVVLFAIAGMFYSGGGADVTSGDLITSTLKDNFTISPLLIIPAILVLVISFLRIPALPGLGCVVVISVIFAMVFQGTSLVDLLNYAYSGFSIDSGVDAVDAMLNRGGVVSMQELIVIYLIAGMLGAIITTTGMMDVIAKNALLKVIKNRVALIVGTLLYGYLMNFLTAGVQTATIILTEQTFVEAYDEMNIDRKVLSRTLEDAGTLGCLLVPWGITSLYIQSVLNTTSAYIPFAWLVFAVPVFSIICAVTGIGIWDGDHKPMWNKREKKAA